MSNLTNAPTKPTNIPWLGDIPADWDLTKIGLLCEIGRGRVLSGETMANNHGIYPVYSSQTSNNGIMGYLNTYDFDGDYVTWTTDGANAGTAFLRSGKFNCTNVCGTIKTKPENLINLSFLPYLLNFITPFYVKYDINPKMMSNVMAKVEIPLPPLQTQQDIANHLDTKCDLIAKYIVDKTQIIELLKEQKKSLIYNAVTKGLDQNTKLKPSGVEWLGDIPADWEVRRLKDICKINPTKGNIVKTEKEVVFLPMEKVDVNGGIEQDLIKTTNQLSTGFTYFEKNDVIFAKITPCFENGKGAYLDKLETEYGFGSTEFHVLRANLQLTIPRYIDYIRRSDSFMNIGETFMQGSAGQKRITTDFIKDFPAPLPPLKTQQQIVIYLDTQTAIIDDTISKIQREIELIQEFKKSLIYNAVTGKIAV